MLTHVVLMKFTDTADAPKAKDLLERLAATVAQIRTMTAGLDVVRSDLSYDLCLITAHASRAELRGYQQHPAHLELAGWLKPRLADRVIVDFES